MADSMIGVPRISFVNALKTGNGSFSQTSNLANASNYVSVGAMRTRLAAANGGYYTATKMDQMTVNDMIWALRSIDDRTTISDYMPVSTA